ncbi:MAG: EamA family transporter [Leptolyngbyaceae cyanobacterium bins.59]|nr:EamA family transporter [Leptolyngbyaceae cyanobacterium bins.59]
MKARYSKMDQSMLFSWLLVIASGVSGCLGNVFLKKSRLVATDPGFFTTFISPWFIVGLVFLAANLLLFTKALDKLPLSAAVPVSSGVVFVSVAFLSNLFLGESLTTNQWIASSLIVAGVVIMSR